MMKIFPDAELFIFPPVLIIEEEKTTQNKKNAMRVRLPLKTQC